MQTSQYTKPPGGKRSSWGVSLAFPRATARSEDNIPRPREATPAPQLPQIKRVHSSRYSLDVSPQLLNNDSTTTRPVSLDSAQLLNGRGFTQNTSAQDNRQDLDIPIPITKNQPSWDPYNATPISEEDAFVEGQRSGGNTSTISTRQNSWRARPEQVSDTSGSVPFFDAPEEPAELAEDNDWIVVDPPVHGGLEDGRQVLPDARDITGASESEPPTEEPRSERLASEAPQVVDSLPEDSNAGITPKQTRRQSFGAVSPIHRTPTFRMSFTSRTKKRFPIDDDSDEDISSLQNTSKIPDAQSEAHTHELAQQPVARSGNIPQERIPVSSDTRGSLEEWRRSDSDSIKPASNHPRMNTDHQPQDRPSLDVSRIRASSEFDNHQTHASVPFALDRIPRSTAQTQPFELPPSSAHRYPGLFRQGQSNNPEEAQELPDHYYQAPLSREDAFLPRHQVGEYYLPGVGPPAQDPRPGSRSRRNSLLERLSRTASRERTASISQQAHQPKQDFEGDLDTANPEDPPKQRRRSSFFEYLKRASVGDLKTLVNQQNTADPRDAESDPRMQTTPPITPNGRKLSVFSSDKKSGKSTRSSPSGVPVDDTKKKRFSGLSGFFGRSGGQSPQNSTSSNPTASAKPNMPRRSTGMDPAFAIPNENLGRTASQRHILTKEPQRASSRREGRQRRSSTSRVLAAFGFQDSNQREVDEPTSRGSEGIMQQEPRYGTPIIPGPYDLVHGQGNATASTPYDPRGLNHPSRSGRSPMVETGTESRHYDQNLIRPVRASDELARSPARDDPDQQRPWQLTLPNYQTPSSENTWLTERDFPLMTARDGDDQYGNPPRVPEKDVPRMSATSYPGQEWAPGFRE
jgi:hypothetical protein